MASFDTEIQGKLTALFPTQTENQMVAVIRGLSESARSQIHEIIDKGDLNEHDRVEIRKLILDSSH